MSTAPTELYLQQTICVDRGQGLLRLDRFLQNKLPDISRTRLQSNIKAHCIQVNGQPVKPNYRVHPGDEISILLPNPPVIHDLLPEELPLEIVYEDDALIVVNKNADMVVHPGCGNWSGTLLNGLLHHFHQLPNPPKDLVRAGLVHRIDKGTSGLLVIGKQEASLARLAYQFFHHTVHRRYLALVWGHVATSKGTINVPIGRSNKDRRVMAAYAADQPGSKAAITHYEVVQRFNYVTLLACSLETGRTHQIRAHMRHIGHPLFGDGRYGGDKVVKGPVFSKYRTFVENCFKLLPYQALHAAELGFTHPTSGNKVLFTAPLPPAFKEILIRWERYSSSIV